jgi:phage anti-repressor protein
MNFKSFILKYSFINSYFLEDFYNIIKEDYIERYNEFLIDSELLRKWLDIKNRQIFNDTIKKSYKINIDYKLKKTKKTEGRGGHNLEVITLTPEATKKICLSTKSNKGPLVRQYFIELEIVLYKYKNYIIDGLSEKIKKMELNQKPVINNNKKIIYVFRALNTDLTLYKIGKTINSKTRLLSHNSPMANDLELLFQYETENINQVESCVKILMKKAQYRKYKEIYQIDLNILKMLIKECDVMINEVNIKIQNGGKKHDEILYLLIPNIF